MKIRWVIWFPIIVILYLYLNLFQNALIDDAFIALTYVKTIIGSRTWGFFPGYITNSATSPLNIVLLVIICLVAGSEIKASIWLALGSLVVISIVLIRISNLLFETDLFGYLAAVAFVFNPLLISTIGLESIPFIALFVIAVYCFLCKRWYWLGFFLGLLTLTRADGVIVFLVFLFFIPTTKCKFRLIGIYLLTITPWFIYSWIFLGSLIPDTFFIKTAQSSWNQFGFYNGIVLYFRRYPLETFLSFLYFPLALVFFRKQAKEIPILYVLFFIGAFHYLTYSFFRVPPYHWYYVLEVAVIILIGTLSLGNAYRKNELKLWRDRGTQTLVLVCFLVPIVGMLQFLIKDRFTIFEMPIHTNCATHQEYKEVGLWIFDMNYQFAIDLAGEIGTIAYYCDCFILDEFSERTELKDFIDEKFSRFGLQNALSKINFLFYVENDPYPSKQFKLILGFHKEGCIKEWDTSTRWCDEQILTLVEIVE